MQIKSTMRYHLISIQHDCNNKKKKKEKNIGKDVEKLNCYILLVRTEAVAATMEN